MWRDDRGRRPIPDADGAGPRTLAMGRRPIPWETWLVLYLAAIGLLVVLTLPGCTRRTGASGGGGEVRLTHDEIGKSSVRFSPDGRWVAYTAWPGGAGQGLCVYVVARGGGQPRRVSADSLGLLGLNWSGDGKGLYCRAMTRDSLYYLTLDGAVRAVSPAGPFARFASVSADGRTQLLLQFNGDNRDVAVRRGGGKLEFLASTPVWEEDAVFGPGPGDVTAVTFTTFQAPTSRIAVWSARTKAFTDLPLPEGLDTQPAWSPDGRYLACSVNDGTQSDIWVYDSQSAHVAALTADPGDASSPSWSPDGEWLAFIRSTKTSHLFAGDPVKKEIRPLTEGAARDYMPVVSRDGKWVAFARRPAAGATPGAASSGPELCVMPRAGGEITELDLKGVRLAGKDSDALAWSADGGALAFQGVDASGKMDIYRIGRGGQGLARVTVSPGEEVSPMWSPDGRRIAYAQAGGGRIRVMAIPATGGVPQEVSHEGVQSEGSVWAPDGDRVAYVAYRPEGGFDIWIRSLARPQERRYVVGDKQIVWPIFWSRDGRELLLARMSGSKYVYSAFDLESGRETSIGRSVPLPSGHGEYAELNARGERYRDLFYPGGEGVFADGKDTSDIYLLRVRGLLESRLLAAAGE